MPTSGVRRTIFTMPKIEFRQLILPVIQSEVPALFNLIQNVPIKYVSIDPADPTKIIIVFDDI